MNPVYVLWATPRSTSTAFEWMMRTRGDMACFHEPFGEAWYQGDDISNAYAPQVGVDASGNAIAVWDQIDGTRPSSWANRYLASTDSWGTAELLETDDTGNAQLLQIAVDASGNAISVWRQHDGGFLSIWASRFE